MFDMMTSENLLGTSGISNINISGDSGSSNVTSSLYNDTSIGNDNSNGTIASNVKPDLFYAQFRDQSRFWVQRVAVPMIMVIGLFGNLITVIIMTRRRMRSTTNMYLAALAFVDILYLLLTFLLGLSHYPNMDDAKYRYYWQLTPFLMMLTDACSNTSVWLTVTFTVERFIAVRYPMKGKIWCTEQRARKNIIGVFIFGFLAASPVPFEWQIAERQVMIPPITTTQLDNNNNDYTEAPMIIGPSSIVETRPRTNEAGLASAADGERTSSLITMINDYRNQHQHDHQHQQQHHDTTTPPNNHYQNSADKNKVQATHDNIDSTRNGNNNNNSDDNDNDPDNPRRQSSENDVIGVQEGATTTTQTQIATAATMTRLTLDYSELGRNENYRRIYYQLTAILFSFVPLLSLVLFNGFLIKSVHESQRERERMTGTKGTGGGGGSKTNTNTNTNTNTTSGQPNNPHTLSGEHLATSVGADDVSNQSGLIKASSSHHQVISLSTDNNNNNKITRTAPPPAPPSTAQVNDKPNDCDNYNNDYKSRSPQLSSTIASNLPSCDSKIILPSQSNHTEQPSILHRGTSILKHSPSSTSNANTTITTINLQQHSSSQERRITIMLIAVVILFLVCQIPTAAMLLYRSVNDVIPNTNEDALLLAFGNIFNFLMATNAAGNFILYSFLSKKYRKTFVILFCNCLKRGSELTTTATSSSISAAKKLTNSNNNPTTPTVANNNNLYRNAISTAV